MADYEDSDTISGKFSFNKLFLSEFASHVDAATSTGKGAASATIHSYGTTGQLLHISIPEPIEGERS